MYLKINFMVLLNGADLKWQWQQYYFKDPCFIGSTDSGSGRSCCSGSGSDRSCCSCSGSGRSCFSGSGKSIAVV